MHQYKLQLDSFQQLTQGMLNVYQQDDCRRLKSVGEEIQRRFEKFERRLVDFLSFEVKEEYAL